MPRPRLEVSPGSSSIVYRPIEETPDVGVGLQVVPRVRVGHVMRPKGCAGCLKYGGVDRVGEARTAEHPGGGA